MTLFMPAVVGVTAKVRLPVVFPPDPQPDALARVAVNMRPVKTFLNRIYPPRLVIKCRFSDRHWMLLGFDWYVILFIGVSAAVVPSSSKTVHTVPGLPTGTLKVRSNVLPL